MTNRFTLSHTPALDGLRGLAIVLVLCAHIPLSFIRGGVMGVEIFFVLSGFLITSLLLREFDARGRIAFKAFYMRRILRLAPALLLTVALVNVFVSLVVPADIGNVLHDTVMTLAYGMNWSHALWLTRHPWLDHTWSLSIEEQFYIVFPALLSLPLRRLNRAAVILLVTALAFLSWLWRAYLIGQGVGMVRIYHGTDTRLDGLLAGCVLALALATPLYGSLRTLAQRYRASVDLGALAAFVALLLVVWCMHPMDALTYTLGFPLTQLATCVLIGHVVIVGEGAFTSLFAWAPLVWLGKRSYGIYLYHWILIFMLMRLFPNWEGVTTHGAMGVGLSLVAAALSYRYMEAPVMRWKGKYRVRALNSDPNS